jgi:N-glycosylase/DNA lyase
MSTQLKITLPQGFSFRHTVGSHGWYDLPPFKADEDGTRLEYVFASADGKSPVFVLVKPKAKHLAAEHTGDEHDNDRVRQGIRHILRLDEPLNEFYQLVDGHERLNWIVLSGAGRLLRSPSVWEDLVKTLCTTNCSWSLTRKMVTNLVEGLGEQAENGQKAFPTPEAMASVEPEFFRDEIRAGYRSPYLAELSESVAAGKLDPESWLKSDLPTAELKKQLKQIKGVGDYAAENLLKLLGRYDGGIALDSWVRSQFYKKHNRGKVCDDKRIIRFYDKFGKWKGLAAWCDVTEHWFNEPE